MNERIAPSRVFSKLRIREVDLERGEIPGKLESILHNSRKVGSVKLFGRFSARHGRFSDVDHRDLLFGFGTRLRLF